MGRRAKIIWVGYNQPAAWPWRSPALLLTGGRKVRTRQDTVVGNAHPSARCFNADAGAG